MAFSESDDRCIDIRRPFMKVCMSRLAMAWRRRGIPRMSPYPIISMSVLKHWLSCITSKGREDDGLSRTVRSHCENTTFSRTMSFDSLFSATANGMYPVCKRNGCGWSHLGLRVSSTSDHTHLIVLGPYILFRLPVSLEVRQGWGNRALASAAQLHCIGVAAVGIIA